MNVSSGLSSSITDKRNYNTKTTYVSQRIYIANTVSIIHTNINKDINHRNIYDINYINDNIIKILIMILI